MRYVLVNAPQTSDTTCAVGWYVWRPGGGVGGGEQVAK